MIYYIFFIILLAGAAWCAYQISRADFRRRIIPDAYLFPLMLIGLILSACMPTWPVGPIDAAVGAAFGYAMAAIVGVIFERTARHRNNTDTPIGLGDIKLIAVGGVWLGAVGLSVALFISCITGIIWARRHHEKFIPFAPFFILGGFLALLANAFLI